MTACSRLRLTGTPASACLRGETTGLGESGLFHGTFWPQNVPDNFTFVVSALPRKLAS